MIGSLSQEPASQMMRSVLDLLQFVLIMMTAITIFVLLLIIYVVIRLEKMQIQTHRKEVIMLY